jgi:hypothetical protein
MNLMPRASERKKSIKNSQDFSDIFVKGLVGLPSGSSGAGWDMDF